MELTTHVTSGSFIEGENPLSEPISLFLLQVIIIVVFARALGYVLQYVRQPPVIAEVLGGILLGPTLLCRIPAFKATVFPDESLGRLKLVADFGLVLYLFLVGMELDPHKVAKDFKKSSAISIAGIILPFGLGTST
jgi:Kef-type K+ transport system membrane component KefB